MLKIYKYKIEHSMNQIQMPIGAQVLKFDTINNEMFIWALHHTDNTTETRYFKIIGTGHEIAAGGEMKGAVYVGTAQQETGRHVLVWHLFEIFPESEIKEQTC